MSQRIEKLRNGLYVEGYPICTEKGRLYTESFQQTEDEPLIIRRAKALVNIWDHITIFIENGELIVGNAASKPRGFEIDWESGIWPQDEIDALREDGFIVSKEDEAEILSKNEYWLRRGKGMGARASHVLPERLFQYRQTGIMLPPWKSRDERGGGGRAEGGLGFDSPILMCLDIPIVLNRGLNSMIKEAEQELRNLNYMIPETVQKQYFLESIIMVHKGLIRFANRFSDLATRLAGKEADKVRKQELEKIAEICRWVPANPARSFYEAIQSFWFVFLMLTPSTTVAAGRFDQYMYPFYKKDIDQGKTNDEEVLELLQCLRIKDMHIDRVQGKRGREKNSGLAKWHNWTIGGITTDGKDATNELTYLILEAAKRCRTPHYTITVRVHEDTPEELMLKSIDVVKTGIGMPAFIGDKSYIEYLLSQGVSLKDARDYVMTGCLDCNLMGKSATGFGMFIVPLIFDIFIHNGILPRTGQQIGLKTGEMESFATFEEFYNAFKKQLAYFMSLEAECTNINMQLNLSGETSGDPFRSSLMEDAVKVGKDMFVRQLPFDNRAALNPVGIINVADSMAAVKKLVYDEQKVSMKELKNGLLSNWQGAANEQIRQMCLAAPKYGNDDDYVDMIAKDLYQFWAETTSSFHSPFGSTFKPAAISISAQWPGGALTGATPDGRYSGECLADGTMSAMRGKDIKGPTALLKSAMKIDQVPYQSTLLNMKFHPSALKSQDDMRKLSSLIRTYFSFGGKHVQFNVVNKESMVEAQASPEAHRDLIVRVAGYSAYFIELNKVIQNEIIGRTEHELKK